MSKLTTLPKKTKQDKAILALIGDLNKQKSAGAFRQVLLNVLKKTIDGSIETKHALSIARIAGVIVASSKVQVDYKRLSGNPKKIDFLEK